ncbi:MAG: hypothetical protein HWD59_05940 [Coxiellaceae bacterium]|nr:MAG: hypothetical protein HWD59_05940 [Coxiellaceae bacterium]
MLDSQNINTADQSLLDEIFMSPSNKIFDNRFSSEQHSTEAACGTACGAGCGGGCGGKV